MNDSHVQISLKEYHELKGDRDDFLDKLNDRIEKQSIEIEKLKSGICIVTKNIDYRWHDRESETLIFNTTASFYSEAKSFLGIVDCLDDDEKIINENEVKKPILRSKD